MQDAVSLESRLNRTHFESAHVYRVEWEPGPKGFIDFWVDDTFIFGIDAVSLRNRTGSMIPEEPMYIILNVALSHNWGFPEPCDPLTCSACWACYDCTNPACQCALPYGLRDCKSLPAEMTIDYIRLYQVCPNRTRRFPPQGTLDSTDFLSCFSSLLFT